MTPRAVWFGGVTYKVWKFLPLEIHRNSNNINALR